LAEAVYLIQDPERGGYAMDNPIEGWCFTTLRSAAKEFPTFREARQVADQHFNPGRKVRVRIVKEAPQHRGRRFTTPRAGPAPGPALEGSNEGHEPMSDSLEALAARARTDPWFLGFAPAAHQDRHELTDAALTRELGCPDAAVLAVLRLCRRPPAATAEQVGPGRQLESPLRPVLAVAAPALLRQEGPHFLLEELGVGRRRLRRPPRPARQQEQRQPDAG
jgi:hypothetical protein